MRETVKAIILFDAYIKRNECFEGQLGSTVHLFRKKLMIPILNMIKELEKKTDE